MISKKSIIFLTIAFALLSIEFSLIYVPETFEGPLFYRVQTTIFHALALMVVNMLLSNIQHV